MHQNTITLRIVFIVEKRQTPFVFMLQVLADKHFF